MEELNKIGSDIIGAAFEVRNELGKYLLESFYVHALAYELMLKGHKVECEKRIPVVYKGSEIKDAFRIDILVDDKVVIECKSLNSLCGLEFNQISTYLHLGNYKLGYIINFSAKDFRPGVWDTNKFHDMGIIRVIR